MSLHISVALTFIIVSLAENTEREREVLDLGFSIGDLDPAITPSSNVIASGIPFTRLYNCHGKAFV